jgi:hypothetical protein
MAQVGEMNGVSHMSDRRTSQLASIVKVKVTPDFGLPEVNKEKHEH